jgi:7,8-dihydro-6-hydroxymethylpterin-pyrophosphokinase
MSSIVSSPPNKSIEPPSFLNLEKVVQNYGNQPELLELILSSKVEEDRRRAEEAKLRRKEIDYLLQKQSTEPQRQKKENSLTLLPPIATKQSVSLPRLHHHTKSFHPQYDAAPSISATWTNSNTPQYQRKSSPRRNSNSIEMLLSPSPRSMDIKLPELSLPSSSSTSLLK